LLFCYIFNIFISKYIIDIIIEIIIDIIEDILDIQDMQDILEYDYLIAGAGIAGLYTAYHLHKKNPSARICILESSGYIGGRLHTISYDGIKVDAGGARFNTKQYRILELVKELGLDKKKVSISSSNPKYIPIHSNNPKYESILENIFSSIDDVIKDIKQYIIQNKITNEELINTTILEFANKYYSNNIIKFVLKIKQIL
jgi:monoamine oxidase